MANNITYVKQKSGVIYAYENLGTWDKVNKKPICRRRLIGKVDPVTKEIVPFSLSICISFAPIFSAIVFNSKRACRFLFHLHNTLISKHVAPITSAIPKPRRAPCQFLITKNSPNPNISTYAILSLRYLTLLFCHCL